MADDFCSLTKLEGVPTMNIGVDIDNTITNTRELIIDYVQIFAKENNLTLDITYKETTDVEENIVLSQGRDPGDPIYNGYTLKITI